MPTSSRSSSTTNERPAEGARSRPRQNQSRPAGARQAGRSLPLEQLCKIGEQLGSDVPFFLLGGKAVGIGRGTELFPLPDGMPRAGVIVAPEIHVSTAGAYLALSPRLTTESQENKIFSF